jgi:pimeloyl-ACP methyl ester carboxylesterase
MRLVRLHVEAEGDGPVVVLAHGFAGSARNLGPQARALRDRYRVVRYDARGHARSEAPDDPAAYTMDALVADLAAVLDQTGARDAVVGGVSMGAMTALAFAIAHPERVRGLVVAGLPAGRESGRGLASIAQPFADAIEREGLEAAGARFVWGPDGGTDEEDAKLVRQGFMEHPPHALVHLLRNVAAVWPDVRELGDRLSALDPPALVVAGERDGGAVAQSRLLAATLPQARLEVVPGAGHLVNLEAAKRFNAVLREWLDGLPSPR